MNSSPALYRTPSVAQQEAVSPLEPLPQYRDWQHDDRNGEDLHEQIAYLKREMDRLKRLRLELYESRPDVEYIEFRLVVLIKVAEHRNRLLRRYRNDPLALSSPRGTGKVGELASDLKQLWPLPRFCRDLLLLDLQGHGDRLRARCPVPIHNDKSPSFVVFVDTDRWHCFGACNAGGDIYDLIKAIYRHEDFTAQVRMLAEATGQFMAVSR